MFDRQFALLETLASTAVALGEIAAFSPMVVALRTQSFAGGLVNPLAGNPLEHGLMVAEKIAVLAEASIAASAACGLSMMAGRDPVNAVAEMAQAAAEPVRRRVRANLERLSCD